VAESAHPLGDAELAALTTLAGRLSGKKVQLTSIVRADLLGGVRLRVGNVLYDGSLRAALDQLQHTLTQTAV
jgi:F-type H+-transporting ATPase subunit delta